MRFLLVLVSTFAAFLTLVSVSHALDVRANRTNVVGTLLVTEGRSCRYIGALKHSVQRAPQHGRIDVAYERHVLDRGKCAGRRVGIMVIRYTPNRGYRGKDAATVVIRWPEFEGSAANRSRYYRLDLNVK